MHPRRSSRRRDRDPIDPDLAPDDPGAPAPAPAGPTDPDRAADRARRARGDRRRRDARRRRPVRTGRGAPDRARAVPVGHVLDEPVRQLRARLRPDPSRGAVPADPVRPAVLRHRDPRGVHDHVDLPRRDRGPRQGRSGRTGRDLRGREHRRRALRWPTPGSRPAVSRPLDRAEVRHGRPRERRRLDRLPRRRGRRRAGPLPARRRSSRIGREARSPGARSSSTCRGASRSGSSTGLGLYHGLGASTRTAIGTGGMGAYTTFSTFTFETVRLAEEGATDAAVRNVAATFLVGLAGGRARPRAHRGALIRALAAATLTALQPPIAWLPTSMARIPRPMRKSPPKP